MHRLIIISLIVTLIPIDEAHAYIGPGLGLGALGVVLGLFISICLALLAFFWYPLKRVLRKSRAKGRTSDARHRTEVGNCPFRPYQRDAGAA